MNNQILEVQNLTNKFLELKKENPVKFLEYLPDFLLDLFIVGIANKLGISEKRPINFWYNTLEKNKNLEYNLKKMLIGSLVFLIGNKLYSKKIY